MKQPSNNIQKKKQKETIKKKRKLVSQLNRYLV